MNPLPEASGWGRWLILAGVVLIVAGLLVRLGPRLPWLGHLPGDIHVRRPNFTLYLPIATCLLLSLLFTLLLNWWRR